MDHAIEAICRIPIDFAAGRVSPVELLESSGYRDARAEATIDRVEECLQQHPEWVTAWFRWSEDKRYSPAWWISEVGPQEFHVGYYDSSLDHPATPLEFESKVRACAEFVVRDVESIARATSANAD